MNATELFDGLAAIEGSREAGSRTNGFDSSRLVNGVEYGLVRAVDERKLRAAWKRRTGGGATPPVLIADDPEDPGKLRVLGPRGDGPVHRVRTESMLELVTRSASLNLVGRVASRAWLEAVLVKPPGVGMHARAFLHPSRQFLAIAWNSAVTGRAQPAPLPLSRRRAAARAGSQKAIVTALLARVSAPGAEEKRWQSSRS